MEKENRQYLFPIADFSQTNATCRQLKVYKMNNVFCLVLNPHYKTELCLCVRSLVLSLTFKSSETDERTNMKFGTIDHCLLVSVIRSS